MQAEICKQQSETKCATYRRYTEVRHLPAVDKFIALWALELAW